jgi:hypothetical protein
MLGYPSIENERFVHMADRIRALRQETADEMSKEIEEEE